MKTIIFDFDGTIADTKSMTVSLVNTLLEEYGYDTIDEKRFRELRKMTIAQGMRELKISPLHIAPAMIKGRQLLHDRLDELQPAKGMVKAIKKLHDIDGLAMGILSSNSKGNVYAFLEKHGLSDKFNFVDAGVSMFGKTTKLKSALRKHRLKAEETIYVGDEVRDVEAAHKVPMRIVSVSWGLNHPDVIKKYKPEHLVHNAEELVTILEAA